MTDSTWFGVPHVGDWWEEYHIVKWRGRLTVHMFRDTGMYSVYTYTLARGWSTRLITADTLCIFKSFYVFDSFRLCPSFACEVLGRERSVSVRQQHGDHGADNQHRNRRCNVTAGARSWEKEDIINCRRHYFSLDKYTFTSLNYLADIFCKTFWETVKSFIFKYTCLSLKILSVLINTN